VLQQLRQNPGDFLELLAQRKDRSEFSVEVRTRRVRLNNRLLLVLAVRDITQRQQAEEETRLLAQAIKAVRDSVIITDLQDNIIFVNDAFATEYQYTANEVLNKSIIMLRSEESNTTSLADISNATQSHGWHGELINKRKDGTVFPIELWTSPVRDNNNKAIALVGVARDISERLLHENEIIDQRDKAERSERLKDAFIANISHEIRTPLNIILGFSSLVSEDMSNRATEEERDYLESISRGANRLMRTVDMILIISRLQVGDFEVYPVSLNLSELVRQLVADYQTKAEEKQLSLTYECVEDGLHVMVDEYCLMQSMQNLIDNALKYTPQGSVVVRVYREADGATCIDVEDTGIGISSDYLPNVFSPYTQEESGYTRAFEGIGLGLSLVKKYSEMINATIHLESVKGKGTVARIRFPARNELADRPEVTDTAGLTCSPPPMRKGSSPTKKSILIVEDDALTKQFMMAILKNEMEVHLASCCEDAIKTLNEVHVDCILMDISLAGDMNGLELTEHIKSMQIWRHIPIIATTANAFPEDQQRCLAAGCDGYLSKPLTKHQLLEIINRVSNN
jgi:PAS domain S-box-containing protein